MFKDCPLRRTRRGLGQVFWGCVLLVGLGSRLRSEEIVVGVEYAPPGLAKTFAPLGVSGVKFYPDEMTWGKMQAKPDGPIDFSFWDQMIGEYQEAGFRDIILVLKSQSGWGSKNAFTNYAPKQEHLKRYASWVRAVVERYDGDGKQDLPNLRWPVRYYEVGSEFSSFEPGPTSDYLSTLEVAYRSAHSAYDGVQIAPAGFLVTTVFRSQPTERQYDSAFAETARRTGQRILYKKLGDIRMVLDHPEWFDVIAFHALGDPAEIEATTAWLRWEMKNRAFHKPLLITDTAPTPFIAWGSATDAAAPLDRMGVVVAPATESDRDRLAIYFKKLLNGDEPTQRWLHGFVAADVTQKVVIAAEQEIALINTSFMEEFPLLQGGLAQGGAGNSAWAGMAKTRFNLINQKRTVVELRPAFYALAQLQQHIRGYESVARMPHSDRRIRLYKFVVNKKPRYVGWLEPTGLILPGDEAPEIGIHLDAPGASTLLEPIITAPRQVTPERKTVRSGAGKVHLKLMPTPILVRAEE